MATDLSRQWLTAERAALARLSGKRKLDKILDSSQPELLVRSLPAEDLYFTIQEIGLVDAGPLIQLASPKQFRTFVDLDVWKEYEANPEQLLLWLDLARGDDEEEYRRKLHGLDIELLEILLRGIVQIYDLEEDGEPGDVDGVIQNTPEGRFTLVYPNDGAEYTAARQLIEDLYTEDPFQAGRLLYAVRWELHSELTETALRWRNARLADLGFPSKEEAVSLYAKVPLEGPLPPLGAPPAMEPGFFLAGLEKSSLLDRALEHLGPERKDELSLQLVTVLNSALVADGVDVSDVDDVRVHAKAVRDTLSLGLESLSGGDEVRASTLLAETAWKRIFQVGFTLALELSWKAKRLVDSHPLRLSPGAFLPDGADGEMLSALLQRRPRFFDGERVRAFSTLAEIHQASEVVDRIEKVANRFAELGLEKEKARQFVVEAWDEAGLARVRFSDLFATAATRRALGLSPAFGSLPVERLGEAIRLAFDEEGVLLGSFVDEAVSWWNGGDAGEAFPREALQRLEAELGPQVATEGFDLDPRFVAPLIA